ncbi:unnamed protein product [Phytophthora fragariaefolia]|uniref:Unnamed protein product n=1 Tax=Phytophthora fragariaefolia TaxID=1490495 RepID=A0A9W7CYD3_9STRA|nr:unnamed protein product [Phytophthora fragariaefolia]
MGGAHPQRKLKTSPLRRERCRINQARYRLRQRQHTEYLANGIQQLKKEIDDLAIQQQKIINRSPTNNTVWGVASEYFCLFQRGYVPPSAVPGSSSLAAPRQSSTQLEFLKSVMALDVTDGMLCGTEQLLRNWRLFSLHLNEVRVDVRCMELDDAGSLTVTTVTSAVITKDTIRHLFPHLVRGEGEGESWSPLAAKLMNRRLVACGSVRFDWNDATGRVSRLESKVGLLMAVFELLGSLEDAAQVFVGWRVTTEGRFVVKENDNPSVDLA